MNENRLMLPVVLMALGGCGSVGSLDRLENRQAQKTDVEIASEPVPLQCRSAQSTSEACARIHAIRAQACLKLARAETEPDSACPSPSSEQANRWLECAVDSYAKSNPDSLMPSEAANLRENHARALYCGGRAQLRNDASPENGVAMAREAGEELSRLPPTPERDLLAASSILFVATYAQLSPLERCATVRRAVTLASRGLNGAASAPTNLAAALQMTKTAAMQEANSIDGCD